MIRFAWLCLCGLVALISAAGAQKVGSGFNPASTPFSGTEEFYVVQSGQPHNTTFGTIVQQVQAFLGITFPTTTTGINAAISGTISSGKQNFAFTPGSTYTVSRVGVGAAGIPYALLFNSLPSGLFVIEGNGSTIQLSGTDISSYADILEFQNANPGSTVRINNLTLTYQTPPSANATLTSKVACVANANGSATFQMLAGFSPAWAKVGRIDQYDPTKPPGLFVTAIIVNASETITNNGGGSYTVAFNGSSDCTGLSNMVANDFYTLENQQFGDQCIDFWKMQNIILDNVKCTSTAGDAFLFQGANDVTLVNGTGTYYGANPRLSSNGVGFAGTAISGTIKTDGTQHFLGTGDDAFFSSPYLMNITTVTDLTHIVLTGVQSLLNVGDTLQFVDSNGVLQGHAAVSAISIGTNTTVTLSTSAPSGVSTSYFVYDQSNAPALCQINGGKYGNSPVRGIYLSCNEVQVSAPEVQNTGFQGILVEYGFQNVGTVPTDVSISNPHAKNTNYNNQGTASVAVQGWNTANTAAASAGQIPNVSIKGANCYTTSSSCVYVSAGYNVSISDTHSQNWNTAAATPSDAQTGCAVNTAAIGLCNDSLVSVGLNGYLGTGTRLLSAGTLTYGAFDDDMGVVLFANRLTNPIAGMKEIFSDSTTNTWGATISGSGSDQVLGFYDGTNWTVAAK